MLKFMYNGLKLNGKLYKGWYSKGTYTEQSKIPANTITIYAKDYERFPKIEGLTIQNNTDTMTDYFENDKIRVTPNSEFYQQVYEAWEKQENRMKKQREKKEMKKIG